MKSRVTMCHGKPSAAEKQTAGIPTPAHSDTVGNRETSGPSSSTMSTKRQSQWRAWKLFHSIDVTYTSAMACTVLRVSCWILLGLFSSVNRGICWSYISLSQSLCPTFKLDPSHALLCPITMSVWFSQAQSHSRGSLLLKRWFHCTFEHLEL